MDCFHHPAVAEAAARRIYHGPGDLDVARHVVQGEDQLLILGEQRLLVRPGLDRLDLLLAHASSTGVRHVRRELERRAV